MNGFLRRTTIAIVLAIALLGMAWAQPPATESGFVQVEDDVRLYYQRWGTGTPTVFVPNRHEVLYAFASLLPFHDVVMWDPRGRGLSSRPDDMSRYGFDAEIADAEALRRHFGAERVTYVGISLWANVGMLYAARHPESVAGVVALGPLAIAAALDAPPDEPVVHDLSGAIAAKEAMEADGRATSDPYAYCQLDKLLTFADSYVDLRAMAAMDAANLCQYRNEHPDRILPVIFEGIFAKLGDWDWRADMERIEAPVLLLSGERDWAPAGVAAFADHVPDLGWLRVPDTSHHVWVEGADTVLPMMDAFFRGEWPDGLNR
jgi:pimeloyl-ACP methyl ester carboxylesterase